MNITQTAMSHSSHLPMFQCKPTPINFFILSISLCFPSPPRIGGNIITTALGFIIIFNSSIVNINYLKE